MPRRRTLDAFLTQGELRGGDDEEGGIITNEEVRRPLQGGTERNYSRAGGVSRSIFSCGLGYLMLTMINSHAKRYAGAELDNFEHRPPTQPLRP